MDSNDKSSAEDNSDEKSVSTNDLEGVWYGKHVHPDINARDARFKIRGQIRKAQSEWK